MARVYTIQFSAVTLAATTATDLFEVIPASNKPVQILGLFLSQSGTADYGDAQDEGLLYSIQRLASITTGTGGTQTASVTKAPLVSTDAAAGFAADLNNTTVATGTATVLHQDTFNVRVGLQLWFPEGCEPTASNPDGLVVRNAAAGPNDALNFNGTLYVRELG